MLYEGQYTEDTRKKMIEVFESGNDLDDMHDPLSESFETFHALSEEEQTAIYKKLLLIIPDDLFGLGYSWGSSDTEFRDGMYKFIMDNKQEIGQYLDLD